MTAKLIKLTVMILKDEKLRRKIGIAVLSIAFGFIYLLCMPVILMHSLGEVSLDVEQGDMTAFTEENFLANLDSEKQDEIRSIQNAGEAIANDLADLGIPEQTIKAQLIYMSYFDEISGFDSRSYSEMFANTDNASLLNNINDRYGLMIEYEQFMRTYSFVLNSTISPYIFSDTGSKNSKDLASWALNAYESGWGFKGGYVGQRDDEKRIRYADNAGLPLGYLNYDANTKEFGNSYELLVYTVQGDIASMPDVAGIGLYDGTKHGIYVGNGEVVYVYDTPGYVTKEAVSAGAWSEWCTYEGISYPGEVQEEIDELNEPDDSSEDDNDEGEG